MRPLTLFWRAALFLLFFVAVTEKQAFAYTDPGTGALIMQAVVASIAGFLFQFRRIKTWFKNRSAKKQSSQ